MENMTVEYKREITDDIEKEVVAFLNSLGGELLIGVNDDGTINGIQDFDRLSLSIICNSLTYFSPQGGMPL